MADMSGARLVRHREDGTNILNQDGESEGETGEKYAACYDIMAEQHENSRLDHEEQSVCVGQDNRP